MYLFVCCVLLRNSQPVLELMYFFLLLLILSTYVAEQIDLKSAKREK